MKQEDKRYPRDTRRLCGTETQGCLQGYPRGLFWGERVDGLCLCMVAVEAFSKERDISFDLFVFFYELSYFFTSVHRGCVVARA